MSTQVARRQANQMARPLNELIPLIKEQLELAERVAEPYWFEIGKLLLEAKAQMSKGEFIPWIDHNFKLSERTAQRYMQAVTITTKGIQNRRSATPPPSAPLRSVISNSSGSGGPSWQAPVKEAVSKINFEALRQDELKRADERKLQEQLAMKLIDIGYKVLAAELHPDKKGGSKEAMIRLNEVRKRLRQYV